MCRWFDVSGKVVVITGGAGRLGRALTAAFVEAGAETVIASRNAETAAEYISSLPRGAGSVEHRAFDLADGDSIAPFVQRIADEHGRIDVWINNAWPRQADWGDSLEHAALENITRDVTTHLIGYFECARRACEAMRGTGGGAVVNLGSIYGVAAPRFSVYEGTGMTCAPAYSMIKGGVVMLTKHLASLFAPHSVRVNCICPGGVFDEQEARFVRQYERLTPMGRMARPDDVVGAALFFSASASAYVTGQILCVDGGWTAC